MFTNSAGPLLLTPDKKYIVGGQMSDDMIIIDVKDILKLIQKNDPADRK